MSDAEIPTNDDSPPELGVFFDLRNPPGWRRDWAELYSRTVETAAEAERLGARSAWVSEHHFFDDGYMPQPLTFLAALAVRTRSMRLGTAIVLAALRDPRHLAEEAAVVDLLSAGRLELGVGAGYIPAEYEAFGAELNRRRGLTDEAVRAVKELLWSGELCPPPVQPRLPIWLGYQGPQGARRAGRLGVGLLATERSLLEPYTEGLIEGGHDPADARMGGVINLVVSQDPERAADRLVPFLHHQQSTYGAGRSGEPPFTARGTPSWGPADLLDPDVTGAAMAVVDVDTAVATIRARTAGLPVRHLYLWASVAGMPDDMVEEHLSLVFGPVAAALATPSSTAS